MPRNRQSVNRPPAVKRFPVEQGPPTVLCRSGSKGKGTGGPGENAPSGQDIDPLPSNRALRDQFVDDPSVDVGEPIIPSLVLECQLGVIHSEQVEVMHVNGMHRRLEAELVGRPVREAGRMPPPARISEKPSLW